MINNETTLLERVEHKHLRCVCVCVGRDEKPAHAVGVIHLPKTCREVARLVCRGRDFPSCGPSLWCPSTMLPLVVAPGEVHPLLILSKEDWLPQVSVQVASGMVPTSHIYYGGL